MQANEFPAAAQHRLFEYCALVGIPSEADPSVNTKLASAVRAVPKPEQARNGINVSFSASVLWRYPKKDHADYALQQRELVDACFPAGLPLRCGKAPAPALHDFVLTDCTGAQGSRVYGTALVFYARLPPARRRIVSSSLDLRSEQEWFVGRALLLLSSGDFAEASRATVAAIFRSFCLATDGAAERLLVAAMHDVRVPQTGSATWLHLDDGDTVRFVRRPLACPPSLPLLARVTVSGTSGSDTVIGTDSDRGDLGASLELGEPSHVSPTVRVSTWHPVSTLSDHVIGTVMAALLTERRVLVIADRVGSLVPLASFFLSAMWPLYWTHLYVPVASRTQLRNLANNAPTALPFLVGTLRVNVFGNGMRAPVDTLVLDAERGDLLLSDVDGAVRPLQGTGAPTLPAQFGELRGTLAALVRAVGRPELLERQLALMQAVLQMVRACRSFQSQEKEETERTPRRRRIRADQSTLDQTELTQKVAPKTESNRKTALHVCTFPPRGHPAPADPRGRSECPRGQKQPPRDVTETAESLSFAQGAFLAQVANSRAVRLLLRRFGENVGGFDVEQCRSLAQGVLSEERHMCETTKRLALLDFPLECAEVRPDDWRILSAHTRLLTLRKENLEDASEERHYREMLTRCARAYPYACRATLQAVAFCRGDFVRARRRRRSTVDRDTTSEQPALRLAHSLLRQARQRTRQLQLRTALLRTHAEETRQRHLLLARGRRVILRKRRLSDAIDHAHRRRAQLTVRHEVEQHEEAEALQPGTGTNTKTTESPWTAVTSGTASAKPQDLEFVRQQLLALGGDSGSGVLGDDDFHDDFDDNDEHEQGASWDAQTLSTVSGFGSVSDDVDAAHDGDDDGDVSEMDVSGKEAVDTASDVSDWDDDVTEQPTTLSPEKVKQWVAQGLVRASGSAPSTPLLDRNNKVLLTPKSTSSAQRVARNRHVNRSMQQLNEFDLSQETLSFFQSCENTFAQDFSILSPEVDEETWPPQPPLRALLQLRGDYAAADTAVSVTADSSDST